MLILLLFFLNCELAKLYLILYISFVLIMNFIPKQTLENLSLIKIAVWLWNQPDIRCLVERFASSHFFSRFNDNVIFKTGGKWQMIEDQVQEKIANLIIPTSLKEKMIGYMQPVGIQILKWIEYHLKYCDLDLDPPNDFCWTPQATIDKKKTAEMLVKDVRISITKRYILACIYCLEDNIPELWNELPKSVKDFFYNKDDKILKMKLGYLGFWGYYVNGEVAKIDYMIRRKLNYRCSYTYLLKSAAERGNKTATEYFLQKLNPIDKPLLNIALSVAEERRTCYPEITDPPKEYYAEVFCFLLSQMNKDQQMEFFKAHPSEVVCYFLVWPFQSSFVEIAGQLWNFLPQTNYHFVCWSVLHKLRIGYKDYNYKKMFRDLWQQIPDDNKRYILNNDGIAELLNMLLLVKDEENFKLIFHDETLIEKNKLIFSYEGQHICDFLIKQDKWDLFKFLVPLLVSSKEEMIKFKKGFEKYVQTNEGNVHIDKCEKLFPLLNDFVSEYDKRKNLNETDSSSAKRLCNIEFNNMTHRAKE